MLGLFNTNVMLRTLMKPILRMALKIRESL